MAEMLTQQNFPILPRISSSGYTLPRCVCGRETDVVCAGGRELSRVCERGREALAILKHWSRLRCSQVCSLCCTALLCVAVYMRCSVCFKLWVVLQCSVLQCVAVKRVAVKCVALHCTVLLGVAVYMCCPDLV